MGIRANNKVQVPDENPAVNNTTQEDPSLTKAYVPEDKPPVTETAVAPKAQAAPPAVSPEAGAVPSLASLKDKWNPEEVGNVFKRVVGQSGGLYCDKISFGEFIDAQVYSHSDRWMAVPVENFPKDPAVAPNCRASYDGKTVYDREAGQSITIDEYYETIKDKFPKGIKVAKYYDIFCVIFNSSKAIDTAKAVGIVQISISPTAVRDFVGYYKQCSFRVKQGTVPATHQNCLRITAEAIVDGNNSYTLMRFGTCPLDVLADYVPILE